MADINADVREDAILTEAQILTGSIKTGMTFSASDTKRKIHYSNVDSKFYSSIGEVWSGTAWVGGTGNTAGVAVSTPATETISGTAANQQDANIENKSAIESNTESILNLTGASMKIAEFGGTFATTEVMFNFDTITPSDNTDLLNANDTTNIVTLGKELRYQFQTFISVNTTSQGAKVLTLRVYNNADDTLLSTRSVDINGGNNNDQVFPLDAVFLDNPLAGLEIYFTAQCTDTGVDLVELNTTIITGGGGGGGIWDIQDGEIVNIGSRPVNVSVATTGIGDVTIAGTGTAYDATYIDTGNNDTFSNPTLSDGVNTLIKDDTNSFWCVVSGITTVNPDFASSQYTNFTGSIEGIYTVVLGAGTDGTATIASGGAGSQAITANSDIVAPVFEVAGKASRRYNYEEGYIQDALIEPESGAAYVTVANGVPREATPVSGAGKAKQIYRSLLVGGVIDENPNLATDVNNTEFDPAKIPCNTDASGADVGIGGSVQVLGKSYLEDGAYTGQEISEIENDPSGKVLTSREYVKDATKQFVSTYDELKLAIETQADSFENKYIVTLESITMVAGTITCASGNIIEGQRISWVDGVVFDMAAGVISIKNQILLNADAALSITADMPIRSIIGSTGKVLTISGGGSLVYETYGDIVFAGDFTQEYWDNTFVQSDVSTLDIPERAALGVKAFVATEDLRGIIELNPALLTIVSTNANLTVTDYDIVVGVNCISFHVTFNVITASIGGNGNLFQIQYDGADAPFYGPLFEMQPSISINSGTSPVHARLLPEAYILAGRTLGIANEYNLSTTYINGI